MGELQNSYPISGDAKLERAAVVEGVHEIQAMISNKDELIVVLGGGAGQNRTVRGARGYLREAVVDREGWMRGRPGGHRRGELEEVLHLEAAELGAGGGEDEQTHLSAALHHENPSAMIAADETRVHHLPAAELCPWRWRNLALPSSADQSASETREEVVYDHVGMRMRRKDEYFSWTRNIQRELAGHRGINGVDLESCNVKQQVSISKY